MEKEMEFFIYLLEHYASYKNISTRDVYNNLEKLNLIDTVYDMYPMYHIEDINNAFIDIDKLIKENN